MAAISLEDSLIVRFNSDWVSHLSKGGQNTFFFLNYIVRSRQKNVSQHVEFLRLNISITKMFLNCVEAPESFKSIKLQELSWTIYGTCTIWKTVSSWSSSALSAHLASRHQLLAACQSGMGGLASHLSLGRGHRWLRPRRASPSETQRWWRSNATPCHKSERRDTTREWIVNECKLVFWKILCAGKSYVCSTMYYVMTSTRQDLSFIVRRLSQYLSEPKEQHWVAAKHVMRRLWGDPH